MKDTRDRVKSMRSLWQSIDYMLTKEGSAEAYAIIGGPAINDLIDKCVSRMTVYPLQHAIYVANKTDDLDAFGIRDLRNRARVLRVQHYSRLSKYDLIIAIRGANYEPRQTDIADGTNDRDDASDDGAGELQ